VSHDLSEIVKLSSQVLMLEDGKVTAFGTPEQVLMRHEVGGKFQFVGRVIARTAQDFLIIYAVLVGRDIVKIVTTDEDISIGDEVVIASKAFNPIIRKVE